MIIPFDFSVHFIIIILRYSWSIKTIPLHTLNFFTFLLISELEAIAEHTVLSAACLATEVGLTIIDRACLFMKNLGAAEGVAVKPYLKLLQYPQSETLYKHLFAALRAYINQFSETLFEGMFRSLLLK